MFLFGIRFKLFQLRVRLNSGSDSDFALASVSGFYYVLGSNFDLESVSHYCSLLLMV